MNRISEMNTTKTLRTAEITTFCAYIAFVVAGLALYGMVDDSPFIPLMNAHIDLAAAWYVIAGGSGIALLAVVLGGLPIGFTMLRRALAARRGDLLLLLAVPVTAL